MTRWTNFIVAACVVAAACGLVVAIADGMQRAEISRRVQCDKSGGVYVHYDGTPKCIPLMRKG